LGPGVSCIGEKALGHPLLLRGFMDWDVVVLSWVFMYFLYLFPLFAPNFKKRISILLFDLDLISFSCLLLLSASLFELSLSVE
jgi:hypothetical protein